MDRIDFRSDTVTWPTPEMREAMGHADVGDDVYDEDPTVRRLEAVSAERMGKEAGLFVASGTMGNLIATLCHATRGDEAIVGRESHTFVWEAGGMAALGGITPLTLPTDEDGRMDPAEIEAAIREDDPHLPRSRLILVENSFGGRGGAPIDPGYFAEVRRVADRHGLSVHLDGARVFNAAAALGVSVARLADDVDSVTFCLSKGLCAPVGSVLTGARDFIDGARRVRKSLGGGMRQVGVLAAAGLIGIEVMAGRLGEDHVRARALADELAGTPGVRIDPTRVRTNIVHFEISPELGLGPRELVRRLGEEHGILIGFYPPSYVRAVTHYWVGDREVRALAGAVRTLLASA